MGAGAIIHCTGQSKLTELGGLYRKMPLTLLFMVVGGVSVSAFPFFSGFVSKSMIITASFESHLYWAAFLLTAVSAGTFLVAGLRLPYLIFFGESRCTSATLEKAADPVWNMRLAMWIASFFCLLIGSYTPFLYSMLPHTDVAFHPYTIPHMAETLQILAFTALAFYFLKGRLAARATIGLDLDWFYRLAGRGFLWVAEKPLQWLDTAWGAAYRVVGLVSLMTIARFSAWFDWNGIDGVVDGTARFVQGLGGRISLFLQKGQIQMTLYYAITFVALFLAAYVWL